MKVQVKTPARLHLGLIDLNGDLGRMFGGFGVGINQPNVILEAETSKKTAVTGEETELVTALMKRFFAAYPTKANCNISINVKQIIPAHIGLGSGTQLSLAVATVLAKLCNVNASTPEIAFAMGRAQRTGVGTAIFEKGGFVVDGGKLTTNSPTIKFPSLIFRQPFPEDWRFVVAVPNVDPGLSNSEEASAFGQLPQMQAEEVGKICRLTMMKLLPALAEQDIERFGDALTRIQNVIGDYFAAVQGGRYSSSAVADGIEFMQKIGCYGVGQSSWGPAFYGVVKKEDAKQILLKVQAHLKKTVKGQVFVAKANNRGARIKFSK